MSNDQLTIPERVSILETKATQAQEDLSYIREKLDELLDLKSRGLGAVWLIGLLIGSGLVGLLTNIGNFLTAKPH